jgi:hypothetical protein
VVAHRKLAGVDDLYTARAAIRQPAPACCGVVAHSPRCSHPAADGTYAPLAVAEALLYAGHCLAAGSCRLMTYGPDGGDLTMEDEDAPELATLRLRLRSKC